MENKSKIVREKLLMSKFVRSGACGQHVTNPDHEMEEKLYRKLGEYWADNKCVLCAITFQTVFDIDQMCRVTNGPCGKGAI